MTTLLKNNNSYTQQLLVAIEQAVSEPVPLVRSLSENFWQQIESLTAIAAEE